MAEKKVSSWNDVTRRAAGDVETCGFLHVHPDIVSKVRGVLPGEETLNRLSELFKIFGDGTRIRILYTLFEEELCVCDLANLLGMTQSAISHHLPVLKDANLILNLREGKTVLYSLADEHVRLLLSVGTEHINEDD